MNDLLRNLALKQQGLLSQTQFGTAKQGTLETIKQLGYVQIDTISVVERAHHHILWNRVPEYQTDLQNNALNQLVQQQQIFEYWFHAASYLPMKDYRYALPQMRAVKDKQHRYFSRGDTQLMNEILARTKAEGSIRLRNIETKNKKNSGGWWNSNLARRSIEQLFMQGDLMIAERHGMEKVYRLTEDCLPSDINLNLPTLEEYAYYLFDTTRRAHGVFTWQQLIHLKTGKDIRSAMKKIVNEQLDAGLIISTNQLGHKDKHKQDTFVDTCVLNFVEPVESNVKLLSPFDNLVIHRERLNLLFEFDYRLECYLPRPKRTFGYFCLPILYGNHIVGRIDCKAHRKDQRLEVISLHLEHATFKKYHLDHDHFKDKLNHALQHFAQFNQCTEVDINK